MPHQLLAPVTIMWGARYTTALNALLEVWDVALKDFEGDRIDMDALVQKFMGNAGNRPLIRTLVYNIKNNMDESDVEDMLTEVGKRAKEIS